MTQVIPVMIARRAGEIGQIGFLAIAHVEQIPEHSDGITLFARPQQFAHRHVQRFTEQIE
ncbi:hypothetical protein D3C81_1774040 [compost metagenome]